MPVIRSWICQNSRCAELFDSWESNPACPKCRCVRVSWCPGGGHMGGHAKAADADLRALAEHFSLDNMNSASRDRGAKIIKHQPPAARTPGNVHTFAGGFTAAINPAQGAQCVPTANHFDMKVKATPGNKLGPGALGMPAVQSRTVVEAAHKR